MKKDLLIVLIERNANAYKERTGYPPSDFWNKIQASHQILNSLMTNNVNYESLEPQIKRRTYLEANKNFVINLCTGIEVLIKDLLKLICDKKPELLNKGGVESFLQEKITLAEAQVIFKEKNFSLGDIINYSNSFQSLEAIDSILTELLGFKFLSEIEHYKFNARPSEEKIFGKKEICLIEEFPDWRAQLSNLFNERHKYVHQISVDSGMEYSTFPPIINILTILVLALNIRFNLLDVWLNKK